MEKIYKTVTDYVQLHGMDVVWALIFLLVAWKIIAILAKGITTILHKREIDPTVASFLSSAVTRLLQVAVILTFLDQLGVKTTSLMAILGAAGLAIGLALQGTLGNLAGGVLIVILRPFKLGDYIEAQGFAGVVNEITLFTTTLVTPDRKTVLVPNGPLATGAVINFSREPIRRVDLIFGIGYEDDLKLAKEILKDILAAHPLVLNDPAPIVVLGELADSSVNFNVRPFVKSEDYWTVFSDIQEQVKLAFDQRGISIPYPQQDVYLHSVTN